MTPFTSRGCPKCMSPRSGIQLRYCNEIRDFLPSRSLCPRLPDDTLAPPVEHMHHTCKTCGYVWVTATADTLDWLPSRRKSRPSSS